MKIVEAVKVKQNVMAYCRHERNHVAVVTEGLRNADVLGITGASMAVEFEIKVSKSDLDKELAALRYATITMVEDRNLAPAEEGSEQMALNMELGRLKQRSGGWTKINKHQEYVDPKKYFEKKRSYYSYPYIPNYFYMVVPEKLVKYTIEQIAHTKYGVIAYDGCRSKDNHVGYKLGDKWLGDKRWSDRPEGAEWKYGGMPCEFVENGCYKEIAVRKKASKIHSDKVSSDVMMSVLSRNTTENISLLREIVNLRERIDELQQQYDKLTGGKG